MNKVVLVFILGALPLTAAQAAPEPQAYRIVGVADGDTLTAYRVGRPQLKCRLYGIDAPEKKQAYGQASKASLSALAFGRSAQIDITGRDRYGRAVCKVRVGGMDVNREQVARGMAWMYRQYTTERSYRDAEAQAQARQLGVWRDSDPVPPWDFRKKGRRLR